MSATSAVARRRSMADKADIHELYEKSVQNVEHEVEFLQTTFQQIRGRKAYLFREDFCGTASTSCQWVKQGDDFQAIGVDIDPSVLEWGRNNRLAKLPTADQPRAVQAKAPQTPAGFRFPFPVRTTPTIPGWAESAAGDRNSSSAGPARGWDCRRTCRG